MTLDAYLAGAGLSLVAVGAVVDSVLRDPRPPAHTPRHKATRTDRRSRGTAPDRDNLDVCGDST